MYMYVCDRLIVNLRNYGEVRDREREKRNFKFYQVLSQPPEGRVTGLSCHRVENER